MPVRPSSITFVCVTLVLAACQQPAANVRYPNNGGQKPFSDEVIKTPTRSVAPPVSSGSAGREAAGYYQQQRLPAARIGAAPAAASLPPAASQPFAPPQPYNPPPVRPGNARSPFGAPSAPLPPESSLGPPFAAGPTAFAPILGAVEPSRGFAVSGAALPVPLPASMDAGAPAAAPMPAPGPYAALLGSQPSVTPAAANDPYSGSIALGGAYGGGNAYGASAMLPASMAAPSLPAPAAPPATQSSSALSAPAPSDFVINGSGDTLKGGTKSTINPDEDSVTQAEAAPIITPVSTTNTALSKHAGKTAPLSTGMTASAFIWPARGPILSGFGPKGGGKSNDGINIGAPSGTPIRAAADGMVVYAGNELQGYGNMLIIGHDGGKSTVYAHAGSLKVKKGDFVKQGQTIGFVGQTGGVSQPQLHFALRDGNSSVDPLGVLKK